jgi:8-oxo-dGTP diphosphatase
MSNSFIVLDDCCIMDKITLAGCVILKNNSILLLNRKKTGWYELPGGKVDDGETVEIAAIRELKEELCCDVEIVRQLGIKDFEENGFVMTYVWFLSRLKDESQLLVGEPNKFDHFKWIPVSDLREHKLSPNMLNLVEELNLLSL